MVNLTLTRLHFTGKLCLGVERREMGIMRVTHVNWHDDSSKQTLGDMGCDRLLIVLKPFRVLRCRSDPF
jgi:hypothetical protein